MNHLIWYVQKSLPLLSHIGLFIAFLPINNKPRLKNKNCLSLAVRNKWFWLYEKLFFIDLVTFQDSFLWNDVTTKKFQNKIVFNENCKKYFFIWTVCHFQCSKNRGLMKIRFEIMKRKFFKMCFIYSQKGKLKFRFLKHFMASNKKPNTKHHKILTKKIQRTRDFFPNFFVIILDLVFYFEAKIILKNRSRLVSGTWLSDKCLFG
jgi:hypothetical protein